MLLIIYKPFALGKIMFWLVLGSIGGIVWGFMSYKEARESIFTDRGTWLGFLVWSILVAIIQFFTLIRGVSFEPLISLLSLLTGIIGLQYLTRAIRYLNLARKEGEL
ncbi:hypothetical protein [Thermosyntropha lipolytica]|nr:hypothetical protein [Thermosyntropha lipolytica]